MEHEVLNIMDRCLKELRQFFKDGFVFCGDTAGTIGRCLRSLFYKNFVSESKSRWFEDKKNEKVKVSDIFTLSQKFSTHDVVLDC